MSLRVAFIGCVASSAAALEKLLGLGPARARVVGIGATVRRLPTLPARRA